MPHPIFLLTYPVPMTRWSTAQAHWGIYVPNNAIKRAVGKIIHVTGNPSTGYHHEFQRNFDLTRSSRTWRLWHIATVDDEYAENVVANGYSHDAENVAIPAFLAAPEPQEPGAVPVTIPPGPADAADLSGPQIGTQSSAYAVDSTPRDKLEREAMGITPPAISSDPFNPDTCKRSRDWVADYVAWMVFREIFPESAPQVLEDAKAVEREQDVF